MSIACVYDLKFWLISPWESTYTGIPNFWQALISVDPARARDDPVIVKNIPYYKAKKALEVEVMKLDPPPRPENWGVRILCAHILLLFNFIIMHVFTMILVEIHLNSEALQIFRGIIKYAFGDPWECICLVNKHLYIKLTNAPIHKMCSNTWSQSCNPSYDQMKEYNVVPRKPHFWSFGYGADASCFTDYARPD